MKTDETPATRKLPRQKWGLLVAILAAVLIISVGLAVTIGRPKPHDVIVSLDHHDAVTDQAVADQLAAELGLLVILSGQMKDYDAEDLVKYDAAARHIATAMGILRYLHNKHK